METKTAPEKIKDDVHRKIGRNMFLFQEFEHLLKFLIANGKIEGYASEFKANLEKQTAIIQKQTMGNLVGKFIENTHSGSEPKTDCPPELKEEYLSFQFMVNADEAYYKSKKEVLAIIVNDRNDLIHHLHPQLDNSIENWRNAELYLDQQHRKLIPEIDALKFLHANYQKTMKIVSDFLNLDEGMKQLESLHLKNPANQ